MTASLHVDKAASFAANRDYTAGCRKCNRSPPRPASYPIPAICRIPHRFPTLRVPLGKATQAANHCASPKIRCAHPFFRCASPKIRCAFVARRQKFVALSLRIAKNSLRSPIFRCATEIGVSSAAQRNESGTCIPRPNSVDRSPCHAIAGSACHNASLPFFSSFLLWS